MYVVICPHCQCATEIYFDLLVYDRAGWPMPVRCDVCCRLLDTWDNEVLQLPAASADSPAA